MKKLSLILIVSFTIVIYLFGNKISNFNKGASKYKDGDIIFHTSKSSQSNMLRVATNSKLTHVGIIFHINNVPYVFEGRQPVSYRSLNSFIDAGENKEYIVLRTRDELTTNQVSLMKNYAMSQIGKNYDLQFTWDDDKMYCSELVYKIFKSAGIKICNENTFKSFDLSNPMVKKAINERYTQLGKKINMNEIVVAPIDIYNSWSLKTIENTYSIF